MKIAIQRVLSRCIVYVLLSGILVARIAPAQTPVLKQIRNVGPQTNRFNIVILSEGYTSAELTTKFPGDAQVLLDQLLATEPYADFANYLNVFTIAVASAESGSDHPSTNEYKNTYFNSTYDSYGEARLLTIPPNDFDANYDDGLGKVNTLLADFLPAYDIAVMVVNDPIYGGSGGVPAIASTNVYSTEIALHEIGHTLAGLGDEYDTPAINEAMETPNTTQETQRNLIRWHDWILDSTPIPTPEDPLVYGDVIGLFEGAEYHPIGWYRPKYQCKMNVLGNPFCEVCAEALVIGIYERLSLIETTTPGTAESVTLTTAETKNFSITMLQPNVSTISSQWFLDGQAVAGVTGDFLVVHGAALATGTHILDVQVHDNTELVRNDPENALGDGVAWALEVTATEAVPPQLLNISTRANVLADDKVLIGGTINTGTVSKKVVFRALGPSLSSQNVSGALQDPILELHKPDGSVVTNDGWKDSQQSEIEAFGLGPTDDREAAIVATLDPGAYTAIVRGANNTTGVGLVEAYDVSGSAASTLANISTRGFVDQGDQVLIGGIILGSADSDVLVRAIGPSLPVDGPLLDPTLELHDSNGALISDNDNWKDTQQAEIEGTGIPPTQEAESAIVKTLASGAYTAIVRGKDGLTGVALVEAYQLNP